MGMVKGDSETYICVSHNISAEKFLSLKLNTNLPIVFYDYEEKYVDKNGEICKRCWGYKRKKEELFK